MPPKKASGLGAVLQPLDVNQDTLREAQTQKRKATSNPPRGRARSGDKGPRSYSSTRLEKEGEDASPLRLQRKIDEAAEEMRHLTQDDQDRRPPQRELRQDNCYSDDDWYEDFHHGNFAFDDASPLSAEL
jgi:hypothetical protein